jgi:hypothetical protein
LLNGNGFFCLWLFCTLQFEGVLILSLTMFRYHSLYLTLLFWTLLRLRGCVEYCKRALVLCNQ